MTATCKLVAVLTASADLSPPFVLSYRLLSTGEHLEMDRKVSCRLITGSFQLSQGYLTGRRPLSRITALVQCNCAYSETQ